MRVFNRVVGLARLLGARTSEARWHRQKMKERIFSPFSEAMGYFVAYGERYIDRPRLFAGLIFSATCFSGVLLWSWRHGWPQDFWSGVLWTMFLGWLTAGLSASAIWRIKVLARASDLLPVRIFTSALVVFVVQYAHVDAAQLLDGLFPIEPNQLPFGLAFGTTLIVVGLISMAFIAALIICCFMMFLLFLIGAAGRSGAALAAYVALILICMLIVPLESAGLVGKALGVSNKTKLLVARLVVETDFSADSLCEDVLPGERVVRLGSQGDRGVAAMFGKLADIPVRSMEGTDVVRLVPPPEKFHAVDCNVPKRS